MNFLIIITARKNSKRLPNKNLIKIGNKHLVEYTIDFAKKYLSKYPILMSSDSKIIHKLSLKKKIYSFIRPAKLSKDNTTSEQVIKYCFNWFIKSFFLVDGVILLQPTTVFRKYSDLAKAIIFFKKKRKSNLSIISVDKKNTKISIAKKNKHKKFIQRNISSLKPNGSFYIISKNKINNKNFYGKDSYYINVKGAKYNIDINDYYDLQKCKKYLK
jgi:CMP-N-acetylneuraminic acid synthetase